MLYPFTSSSVFFCQESDIDFTSLLDVNPYGFIGKSDGIATLSVIGLSD